MLNLTTINKNKCNDRKKTNKKVAIMPNLGHSLDAANLCIVINIINYFNQVNLGFHLRLLWSATQLAQILLSL